MNVSDLAVGELTAVVGAGGKKTTLYTLANRLDSAVLTATVRIPIFDDHVEAVRVTENPTAELSPPFPLGLVPERERDDRYRGYNPERVDELAAAHDGPVLVKADGARNRLFKAPNDSEPRIPERAGRVVVVASVRAVGERIDEKAVHRPERVAELAGVDVGAELTTGGMARVLGHADGGLKGIPKDAECVVLLNMVDDEELKATATKVATALEEEPKIDRIVLARMNESEIVAVR